MHTLVQICHLSLRDYLHERLLSACAVLGLAAVLAPLLILFGVKFGVVETLTERLRNDPATLEISPVGSGHFSAADMDRWRDDGRVAFVMPRTRTLAATVELLPERGTPLHVSMEPTGHEDPMLARHALPVPALLLDSEDDPDHPGQEINGYGLLNNYVVDYGDNGDYNVGDVPETIRIENCRLLKGSSTLKSGFIGGYASGKNYVYIID